MDELLPLIPAWVRMTTMGRWAHLHEDFVQEAIIEVLKMARRRPDLHGDALRAMAYRASRYRTIDLITSELRSRARDEKWTEAHLVQMGLNPERVWEFEDAA